MTAPLWKVVEVGHCNGGDEWTDYLIAEEHCRAGDIMAGAAPILAQAADRLTADIIVDCVNARLNAAAIEHRGKVNGTGRDGQ